MAQLLEEILTDVFNGDTNGKSANWGKKAAGKARLAVLEIAGSLTPLRRVSPAFRNCSTCVVSDWQIKF